jgi:hypothetical protein
MIHSRVKVAIVDHSNRRQYAVTPEPVPRPCKRFSKRPCLNKRFLKHLPTCAECRAVIVYLDHQSDIDMYVYRNRN